MNIVEQVSLKQHSTMKLGGTAAYMCEVLDRDDLLQALRWADEKNLPYHVIGSGSNIIWHDDGFAGLLIVNRIEGFEIIPRDSASADVTVGAGENWDMFVEKTVAAGYSGVEAMSLIPGTCGATPIQNVGAYGQDISQTLVNLEAYDTRDEIFVTIKGDDCSFGYRTSRFNRTDRGRFIVVSLTFHLTTDVAPPPYYPPVEAYLDEHQLEASAASIRQAVIAIRTSKLPDLAKIGNNGSFFANPIISQEQFQELHEQYPEMRFWETEDGVKISGAWLIEQAGYKDFHDPATGMATWTSQPLVVVNETAPDTAALLTFKQKIVSAVEQKFGITLIQEPELLP